MARLPKLYYFFVSLILIATLTGCELRRDSSDVSDPGPVGELPTLAPLGSESVEQQASEDATAIPTVINVEPTAVESTLSEGQAASEPQETVAPTSAPASISASAAVENTQTEQAAAVEPETFTAPAQQAATESPASQEPIVVDATTSDLAQDGGPIASNPPVSQTTGDYAATPYDNSIVSGSTYTVQPGDTLFSIAQRFGTTVEAIAVANGLSSDLIFVGQELALSGDSGNFAPSAPYNPGIASEGGYHVVAPGETLFRIALNYGTSVDAVAAANGIPYPYIIQVGQKLVIPAYGSDPGLPPPPAGGFYQPDPGYGYQDPGFAPDNSYAAPGQARTHTVAAGETLFMIAQYYGTTPLELAAANGLSNPNEIYVGQVLYLP